MLFETMYPMAYAVMATFHNLIFVIFVICLIRIFTMPFTPYSAYFVGLYAMLNSFYNGCPLLEIQNYLARQFSGNLSMVDGSYELFGDLAIMVRLAVFLGGVLLVYSAHISWDKAKIKVNWNHIFRMDTGLTVSTK